MQLIIFLARVRFRPATAKCSFASGRKRCFPRPVICVNPCRDRTRKITFDILNHFPISADGLQAGPDESVLSRQVVISVLSRPDTKGQNPVWIPIPNLVKSSCRCLTFTIVSVVRGLNPTIQGFPIRPYVECAVDPVFISTETNCTRQWLGRERLEGNARRLSRGRHGGRHVGCTELELKLHGYGHGFPRCMHMFCTKIDIEDARR